MLLLPVTCIVGDIAMTEAPGSQSAAPVIFGPAGGVRMAPPRAPQLLWIDPDTDSVAGAAEMLRRNGLEVTCHASPHEAFQAAQELTPDLIILETATLGADGLALCRELSASGEAPLLAYSVAAETLDRVAALEFGADDILGKDAHPLELLARVRALLRRRSRPSAAAASGWRFDPQLQFVAGPCGVNVRLTASEAQLLQVFLDNPNRVLSREQLLERLHGTPDPVTRRAIDTAIARLRRKLNACEGGGDLIRTHRRDGYILHATLKPARLSALAA
jgi:two-component system, OmpR family, response regulator